VVAVDGSPVAGLEPGGEPQREPEEKGQRGVQGDRPVGEAAVEVHGRADDRHLADDETDEQGQEEVHGKGETSEWGLAGSWRWLVSAGDERYASDRGGQRLVSHGTARCAPSHLSPDIESAPSMPDDPTRPPLPPARRVPLPGRGTTWVVEAGPERAPTLVLLHGLGATAALNWFRSIRPLGARFRVLALDQRAPGRGIRPNRPSRLKDCPP